MGTRIRTDRLPFAAVAAFMAVLGVAGVIGIALSLHQISSFHHACTAAGGQVGSYHPPACADPGGRVIHLP